MYKIFNKNLKNIILFSGLLGVIFFTSINAEASSINEDYRDALMNGMGEVFSALIEGEGFGTVINSIFIVCSAIAIFQVVDSHGGSNSFLLEWSKLVFYMYVVLAILGKVSVTSFLPLPQYALDPLPGTKGTATLDVAIYRIAQREFNSIAEDISKDFNEDSLTNAADIAVKVSFGMLKGAINCDSKQPATYGSCFNSYIVESKADEAKREADEEKNRESSSVSAADFLLNFGANFFASYYQIIITFLVKAAIWILLLLRTMVNYLLLFSSIFITLISFFFIKFFAPFLLLDSYRGRVISAMKIPISTALYGLMSSIVIALSTAVLASVNSATKMIVVGRLTSGGIPVSEILQVMMGNFAILFIVLLFQIIAMSKIPTWSKSLMDLSINTFVDLSESLVENARAIIGPAIGYSIPWVGGVAAALGSKLTSAASAASGAYTTAKDMGESTSSAVSSAAAGGFANFAGIRTPNSGSGPSGGSSDGGSGGGSSGYDGGFGVRSGSGSGGLSTQSASSIESAKSIGLNNKNSTEKRALESLKNAGKATVDSTKSILAAGSSALGRIIAGDDMGSVLSGFGNTSFSAVNSATGSILSEGKSFVEQELESRAIGRQIEKDNFSRISNLESSESIDLGEGGITALEDRINSGKAEDSDFKKLSDLSSLSTEKKGSMFSKEEIERIRTLQETRLSSISDRINSGKGGEKDYEEIFRISKASDLNDKSNEIINKVSSLRGYSNWNEVRSKKAKDAVDSLFETSDVGVSGINFSNSNGFIEMSNSGLLDRDSFGGEVIAAEKQNLLKERIKERTSIELNRQVQLLSNRQSRLSSKKIESPLDWSKEDEISLIKVKHELMEQSEKAKLNQLSNEIEKSELNIRNYENELREVKKKLSKEDHPENEKEKLKLEREIILNKISQCEESIKSNKESINGLRR